MADTPNSGSGKRLTDRDLARLMKQGMDELEHDPSAAEIRERIQDRQNVEEDRDHRARSDSSAVIGFIVGLLLLIGLIVVSIATFQP